MGKVSNFVFDNMSFDHKTYENPTSDFFDSAIHKSQDYELLYFLQGDVALFLEDKYFKLQEHDVLLVKKDTAHYIKILSNQPYERYVLSFEPDECPDSLIDFLDNTDLINCRHNKNVLQTLQNFEFFSKLPESDFKLISKGLLKQLLFLILQALICH